eukprot:tig00001525_g9243.t1
MKLDLERKRIVSRSQSMSVQYSVWRIQRVVKHWLERTRASRAARAAAAAAAQRAAALRLPVAGVPRSADEIVAAATSRIEEVERRRSIPRSESLKVAPPPPEAYKFDVTAFRRSSTSRAST